MMDVTILLSWIVGFIWLATVLWVAWTVIHAARNQPLKSGVAITIGLAVLALVLTLVNSGLVFIQPQELGVVISAFASNGYRQEPLKPGLSWVIPFFEKVEIYPIFYETYTMSIAPEEGQRVGDDSIYARTADGQEILVDASVIFAIDPEQVIRVHILWQDRYQEELVRTQARSIIRDAVSQFNVNEVVSTKRFELIDMINKDMSDALGDNGLLMVDFVIRNIAFSPEYAAAVEQKQIAEQQSQQAELLVEKKKQEAEQARQQAQGAADAAVIIAEGQAAARILEAEAEAEALNVQAEVLADYPDLLTYVYITKLSPNVDVMFLPSDSPFIFPLPDMSEVTTPETEATPTVEPTETNTEPQP
ncbi:MAG: prohibitin family protein [Chloroflexota bacterium]|nr:prohibitin family protein [Chloroflexota bacterium]